MVTSGVRVGTPGRHHARLRRRRVPRDRRLIADVLDGLSPRPIRATTAAVERAVAEKVVALCDRFPIY
jgi:glycine hydroxymethyltransferase